MKCLLKTVSSILISCFATQSAMAGSFTITKSQAGLVSAIQGEAAAPKVGGLIGADLYLSIAEDVVEVKEKAVDGSSHTISSGNVFELRLDTENKEASKLQGYCFLNAGEKLSQIIGDKANTGDLIVCIDGQKLTGQIIAVDSKMLSVRENGVLRLVRVRDIRSIASGHVLKLSAYIFDAASQSAAIFQTTHAKILRFDLEQTLDDFMTASGKRRLETAIDAAGYTKWQRAALIGASVLITGAAIAVPVAVAVPLAGRHQTVQKAPPSKLETIQR